MEACLPGSSQLRLFILDTKSDLKFLIDTGADVSAFPKPQSFAGSKHDLELHAANGTIINTYGTTNLDIDFGLRRRMSWNFWLADLPFPILGADALVHFDLIPDLKRKRLIDNVTQFSIVGDIGPSLVSGISLLDPSHPVAHILSDFPQLVNNKHAAKNKLLYMPY